MRIYKVEPDVNHFQAIYFKNPRMTDKALDDPVYRFDGWPVLSKWKPPEVFVLQPRLKVPNFWAFEAYDCIGFDQLTRDKLQDDLEMCGELLPVKFATRPLWLFHGTQVVDCAEDKRCKGSRTPDGRLYYIDEFAFIEENLIECALFRVPQSKSHYLAPEWDEDPQHEFKAAVEYHKLTGLSFTVVWETRRKKKQHNRCARKAVPRSLADGRGRQPRSERKTSCQKTRKR